MRAHQLQQIDKEQEMHMQAWLNHVVTSTKEQGKKQVPVFKKFSDFYNYEKRIKEVENPKAKGLTEKQRSMARMAAVINSR